MRPSMLSFGRTAAICLGALCLSAPGARADARFMPLPASVTFRPGGLPIGPSFHVALRGPSDPRIQAAARRFLERLERISGVSLDRAADPGAGNDAATLLIEWKETSPPAPRADENESYVLEVDPVQARLRASTAVGVLRGLETLLQSVETRPKGASIPALLIRDQPRFRWRGVLLDSARHFLPVESIKHTLEGMAAFKFNVLHWHLSDDQGFRLESKRFPKLHRAGSGGMFATEAEICEIVAFA